MIISSLKQITPDLTVIVTDVDFQEPLNGILPKKLNKLHLSRYGESLVGVEFPETLWHLKISNYFESLRGVKFPKNLKILTLINYFFAHNGRSISRKLDRIKYIIKHTFIDRSCIS